MDTHIIANCLSKYFIPHVLVDDIFSIRFTGLKRSIRFLYVSTRGLKVTGSGLRLLSLRKIRVIFINLSKLKGLIDVF